MYVVVWQVSGYNYEKMVMENGNVDLYNKEKLPENRLPEKWALHAGCCNQPNGGDRSQICILNLLRSSSGEV